MTVFLVFCCFESSPKNYGLEMVFLAASHVGVVLMISIS